MQPLALIVYERLLPGSHLVNRLQDLNYRILSLNAVDRLALTVQRESPLLLFVDLTAPGDTCAAIAALKSARPTSHLPIIAFAPDDAADSLAAAQQAGAAIAVSDTALLAHLPQFLDQAMRVD